MKKIAFIAFLVAISAASLWLATAVAQSGNAAGAMFIIAVMTVLIGSLAKSMPDGKRHEIVKPKAALPKKRFGKATNEWRKKRG